MSCFGAFKRIDMLGGFKRIALAGFERIAAFAAFKRIDMLGGLKRIALAGLKRINALAGFKRIVVLGGLLLFVVIAVLPCANGGLVVAFADSYAPRYSYVIELDGGSKFFYMRSNENHEDDEHFLDLDSGLYYADTLESIYTLEKYESNGAYYSRYFYESSLIISNDGIYLAHLPWTISEGGILANCGTAIEFFKNGDLTKEYDLSDLTRNVIGFEFTVSHVIWENYDMRKFDDKSNTLSVTTRNGKTIVFDLTDGSIIKMGMSTAEIIAFIIIIALGLLIIVLIVLKKHKSQKENLIKTAQTPEI